MKQNILKRVWQEVKEVNADFFNLRTVISPDLVGDNATRFFFMMLPNDGAMAHLTLVGTFYIPEQYPESPPIVQLYTSTRRYNVDVYRYVLSDTTLRSTMCFDILRSQAYGGSWKPEYTLSSLFASLMSAIVSFYVTQQSGSVHPEYVSMARLQSVKKDAKNVYEQYKRYLPDVPKLPLVEATMVPAKNLFAPQEITVGLAETTVTSKPIYLQNGSDEIHSFAIDLSGLHADVVFSVILSNTETPTDLVGNNPSTILVRNGVTATAARKLANKETVWFYHGKPMNDGDMRLHVTIGRDQMTFAYYEDGHLYVHGDCPVSRLSVDHIGDVKGIPFYVHIYAKDKSKPPLAPKPPKELFKTKKARKEARRQRVQAKDEVKEVDVHILPESSGDTKKSEPVEEAPTPVQENGVILHVLGIDGKGYIHESIGEDKRNDFGFELIQHPETISGLDVEAPTAQDHGLQVDLGKMRLE